MNKIRKRILFAGAYGIENVGDDLPLIANHNDSVFEYINMRELRKFYIQTSRLAYKWINRRSQKNTYNLK